METFETGTKVETPMGSGVVSGSMMDGRVIVKLDNEIERAGIGPDGSVQNYYVTTWAFWPGEVREV
jgi:hypothetical protein